MISLRTVLLVASLVPLACAGVKMDTGTSGGGGRGGSSSTGGGGSGGNVKPPPTSGAGNSSGGGDCVGLECQQTTCKVSRCTQPACGENQPRETTLSGTVYDPAGKVPLYNVVVYVPNAPLDAIPDGLSCVQCAGTASGKPLVSALTDAAGHFVLKNIPVGKNIPVVLQVGKWRRQISIPEVFPCSDNPINDPNLLRLPRNKAEGHIPQIALSTGHSDAIDCLLRKIGIADEEFTTEAGNGRVHMYVGGDGSANTQGAKSFASGGNFSNSYSTLFADYAQMAKYDIVILQCEGGQLASTKAPYYVNMKRYADNGGRVFADHLHFNWISAGPPPWPGTAAWIGVGTDLPDPSTAMIDTSFPKGMALGQWLVNVGATPTMGQIPIVMGQHSLDADMQPVSQRWIYTTSPPSVQYLTFNTPVEVPVAQQCGRVVFTDIHVSAGGGTSHPETPFPTGCTSTTSSAQEKALEFMFFDLSSCIQEERREPIPPVP